VAGVEVALIAGVGFKFCVLVGLVSGIEFVDAGVAVDSSRGTVVAEVPQAASSHDNVSRIPGIVEILISIPFSQFEQHVHRLRSSRPGHEKMVVVVCRNRVDADTCLRQPVRDRGQKTHCDQR